MIKLTLKYLAYKIFSRHRYGHGIHSPFVYQFIRNVLVNREKDDKLRELYEWHKRVSKKQIRTGKNGFGAGSGFIKKSESAVKISAGKIGVSHKYGALLYRIARYFSPSLIIELGTGSGISTAYLASSDSRTEVITVEGDADRSSFAKKMLSELDLNNCRFVVDDFNHFLDGWQRVKKPFLVFVDGDHNFHPTIDYFNYFAGVADNDSIVIFDDIRWSEDMLKAWKTIINDPRAVVSIDLFFMGIVFFNTSVTPQKLIINF